MSEDHISDEHLFAQARHYLAKLEKQCNTMRIFGMTEPKPVREVYVRVNILKKITSRTFKKLNELEEQFDWEKKGFGVKVETVPGFEVVNRRDRFIVLGKPGAGKSTFLKAVTLQSIDQKMDKKRLPVFVSLKEFSDSGKALEEYIIEQFDYCDILNHRALIERGLLAGKVQVLLDGLDEVSKETQKFVTKEILNFTRKYDKNQFIISCRIAAYNYIFQEFSDVEMADFDDKQIQNFINNWFKQKPQSADKCWKKLKEHSGLKELAQVPLLLTLLCITYEEQLDFPPSRSELYEESIDALLKKWDSDRNIYRDEIYKGLSLKRKKTLFSHVAYLNFEASKYFLPKKELVSMIYTFMENMVNKGEEDVMLDSEAVLNAIIAQHGLFVPRAKAVYSFSHLSFQEYFAAMYILNGLTPEDQKVFIQQHLGEANWREVFLMCTEMHLQADYFLLNMKAQIDQYSRENNFPEFLSGVNKIVDKSSVVQGEGGRAICISAICIHDRAGDLALALDLDRDLARALALDLDRDLAFAFARAHDRDRARDRARELARELARARARELTRDRARTRTRARAHARARELELVNYLSQTYFLLQCLNSECYVTKATRQKILNELLIVPELTKT